MRIGVLTNTGTTSKRISEKFKFQFCATKEEDILHKSTNTVFIATRHDSHGSYFKSRMQTKMSAEKPYAH